MRVHSSRYATKRNPIGVLLTVFLLAGIAGAGCRARVDDKSEAAPRAPTDSPITLEVISIGLAGRVPRFGETFAISYRISNNGPATRVNLELFSPKSAALPYGGMPLTARQGIAPKALELAANKTTADRWYISPSGVYYAGDLVGRDLFLLAVDPAGGAVRAVAKVPDFQTSGDPLVVLASNKAQGLRIENEIRLAAPDTGGSGVDVMSVYQALPTAWFEYRIASRVLLARPVSSLSPIEREALFQWGIMGGHLWILEEQVTDWTAAVAATWNGGAGTAQVVSSTADRALTLPFSAGQEQGAAPLLSGGCQLPEAHLVIIALLLIVIVVGPVLHFVCARIKKREWIWIAAPTFSAAAALGMFGLAQAVKGDESAMEVQHLLISGEGGGPTMLSTAIRIQSAVKERKHISVSARTPIPHHSEYSYYNDAERNSPLVTVRRWGLDLASFAMQKWSTRDFSFLSVGAPFDVRQTVGGAGEVTFENRGPSALERLYYLEGGVWHSLQGALGAAKTKRFVYSAGDAFSDSGGALDDFPETSRLRALLYNIRSRFENIAPSILMATCTPAKLPETSVYPTPSVTRNGAHCVFLFRRQKEVTP